MLGRFAVFTISLAAVLSIGGSKLPSNSNSALQWMQVPSAASTIGYRDFSFGFTQAPYGDPNNGPTGEKPQSKLWFNDGNWWGVLYNAAAGTGGEYHIYQLSTSSSNWSDTGVFIDARRYSHADTLWDGTRLYIATAVQPGTSDSDRNARVLRFSYSSATHSYTLDAGFPKVVSQVPVEAIVLAKDSTGLLWVTYTYSNGTGGRSVYVAHSVGDDLTWVTPYVLPGTGTGNLTNDDISAVVAHRGQIGVMWSNQNDGAMYFAAHMDGTADNLWQQNPALQGPQYADDHVNLKSLQADAAGTVFAAVKTSLNDVAKPNPKAPLILLLILDTHGAWSRRTFGTVQENHTRPIVIIDDEHRQLYVFATTNTGNPPSAIVFKQSSLDNINFPSGQGMPFIQSSTDTNVNNATSTRNSVSSQTGLVVLASDLTTGNYWHNTISLSSAATATATATNTTVGTPATTPTPTVAPAVNLSLNRPATASSIESASYPASAAFDGSTSTRWSSQFSDPQWIYVDLGQIYAISRVRFSWETAYARAYQIQVSNDAVSWITIFSTTTGTGGVNDLAVNGTGRYVRMYGTVRATSWGYSLWEFQVFGTSAPGGTSTPAPTPTSTPLATATATNTPTAAPTVTALATATATSTAAATSTPTATPNTTNRALNRPATASSIESTSYPASAAVDGSTSTRWSSQWSDPQWIYVDLGQTCAISRVVLRWETAYGKAYQIQVSNDAINWTTIFSTATGTGGVNDLSVSGTGRYVRVYGTVRGTQWGYSLWELQAYGQ